ncbi:MAG: hypothetical protein ABI954_11150 [Pyrinomonadaceae bacterium]
MKNSILLAILGVLIIFSNASQISAQKNGGKLHTPAKGSAERAAILESLRGNQPVIFSVNYLRVHHGWAWVDFTPLDAETKKPTAEGSPSLLHLENGKWRVMDLSKVPEDPDDPLGAEDASAVFVKNLRQTFAGVPADIFPAPSK